MSETEEETENYLIVGIGILAKRSEREIGFILYNKSSLVVEYACISDSSSYTYLESALLQCKINEIEFYFLDDQVIEHEEKKINNLCDKCGLEFVVTKTFQTIPVHNLFDFSQCDPTSLEKNKTLNKTFSCFVQSKNLINDLEPGQLICRARNLSNIVCLDKAAYLALNLFSTEFFSVNGSQTVSSKTSYSDLFSYLNFCKTNYGSSRLRSWISQPLCDYEKLSERLQLVNLFLNQPQYRKLICSEYLRKTSYLDSCVTAFRRGVYKPKVSILQDVLRAQIALTNSHLILKILESLWENSKTITVLETNLIRRLKMALDKLGKFDELTAFSLDPVSMEKGVAAINPEFNPELENLSKERQKILDEIESHRIQLQEKFDFGSKDSIKLVECNSHHFAFRVTKKDQKVIQNDTKTKIIQIRINKTEYQFTTPELMSFVQMFLSSEKLYQEEQHDLVLKVVKTASSFWPAFEYLVDVLGDLDVLIAFAEAATIYNLVQPIIHPDEDPLGRAKTTNMENGEVSMSNDGNKRVLILKNSRHPLLEQAYKSGFTSKYKQNTIISNDIYMDSESFRMQIITGPNMGGKSTYIRQAGLICLMAQIGCFVPCSYAELHLMDAILCRVGASDDQLRGISTFYSEMIETNVLLQTASKKSLIIIDELGRGTSTHEGLALAWEIARYFVNKVRCFCFFATHFHEMNQLADIESGVFNSRLKVIVNQQNEFEDTPMDNDNKDKSSNFIVFTYKVEPGSTDLTFAAEIAKIVHMDPRVIEDFEQYSQIMRKTEQMFRSDSHKNDMEQEFNRLCELFCLDDIDNLSLESFKERVIKNMEKT